MTSNDGNEQSYKSNNFTSFEHEKMNQKNIQYVDTNTNEYIENPEEHSSHPPQYMNKPESINNKNKQQNRAIKSASRGNSEK